MNRNLVIGIVAHVDSGKTTLAEGILYTCGKLKSPGRVDHKDTLLDNFDVERERGITVFSKQANVIYNETNISLLDTPGHVDFSAEMERTLQVIDAAVLVVSCMDGVAGHTATLWKLLNSYKIPTFIFVNKMDQNGADRDAVFGLLRSKFGDELIDFTKYSDFNENTKEEMSLCSEKILDEYMATGSILTESIAEAIYDRKMFPVLFGSALHIEGVKEMMEVITTFSKTKEYPKEFGARVYKITRDNNGNRLTHVRITGGSIRVKQTVGEEKINQIRIYDGAGYETVDEVHGGMVCAFTGLDSYRAGDILGGEKYKTTPILLPVLLYKVIVPSDTDPFICYKNMQNIAEEIPELDLSWDEGHKEINVHVMGDVQIDILTGLYKERYNSIIEFGNGNIVYKETIADYVLGTGHYEPLRHYSEVRLLMEPGERGSGITVSSAVATDDLDLNWQRLIMSHVEEKVHRGVLTGSALTDVKITIIGGKAHLKHTEGGDFRQSTYRAIRQGLMKAKNVLLEPIMEFELELPTVLVGRAMSDIQRLNGNFDAPVVNGDNTIIKGKAPVASMMGYGREVSAYTKGMGHFSYEVCEYAPCHNTEEVIASIGYEPDEDTANPSFSIFCAHGAGFPVMWNEVDAMAHVNCEDIYNKLTGIEAVREDVDERDLYSAKVSRKVSSAVTGISLDEIEQIYQNTYHKSKEELLPYRFTGYEKKKANESAGKQKPYVYKPVQRKDKYLLVDGYNIIFAWPELNSLSKVNLDSARDALVDICCNYCGSVGGNLILVFDAYKVKGNPGSIQKINNIYVVYTKEAETADQYIEKTVHAMAKNNDIIVATSDGLEQMIIYGEGATRLSAREFKEEVERENNRLREDYNI